MERDPREVLTDAPDQIDHEVVVGDLLEHVAERARADVAKVQALGVSELDIGLVWHLDGVPTCALEGARVGVSLPAIVLGERARAGVAAVDEEHIEGLLFLALASYCEDRLLADVLALVQDPLEAVEDRHQGEEVLHGLRSSLTRSDEVCEDLVEGGAVLANDSARRPRLLDAPFAVRLERLLEGVRRVTAHHLDVLGDGLRRRRRQLNGCARHRL